MSKFVLDNQVVALIREGGMSFNEAIETVNQEQVDEMRSSSDRLSKLSATKLAMVDAGIGSNCVLDAVFKSEHNEILQPAFYADLVDTTMADSDIMQYLVSGTIGVDSDVVKAPTMDLLSAENEKQLMKARVAEGGEFPLRTIKLGSETAYLYKKGIRMTQTYEAARRLKIDAFSRMVRAVSTDLVRQNVADATKVLEKGTLTNFGTSATANVITRDELFNLVLDYYLQFKYAPTTILANDALYKKLACLTYTNTETFGANAKLSLNLPQLGITDLNVINAGVSQKSSKDRILIYNKDYSLTKYNENGSSLTEYAPDPLRQMENVVISEVSGFAKMINSVGEFVSA